MLNFIPKQNPELKLTNKHVNKSSHKIVLEFILD